MLRDVLDSPVSPELLPPVDGVISQRTEDLVGPYELHDFFLYYMLRCGYSPAKVYRVAKLAFKGLYPEVAEDLLQEVLRPAVQTLLSAGRAESGKRGPLAPRRSAHAVRRKRESLAGGGGGPWERMTTDLSENFGIPNLTLTEENRPQQLRGADAPEILKTDQGITAVSTILILVSSF